VHAEAAPDPADGDEQLDELGLAGQQLGELVAALSTFGDPPGPPCPWNCIA